jgi:uncharacterized protein (TIGR00296 family)
VSEVDLGTALLTIARSAIAEALGRRGFPSPDHAGLENAVAAAFRDPRFTPVVPAEFDDIVIEVSLLSKSEPIVGSDEDAILERVVPGYGITIRYGQHRATFLPQVWDSLSDPREFLGELKRKAGLRSDFWSPRVSVSRYRVVKWKEHRADATDVRPGPASRGERAILAVRGSGAP